MAPRSGQVADYPESASDDEWHRAEFEYECDRPPRRQRMRAKFHASPSRTDSSSTQAAKLALFLVAVLVGCLFWKAILMDTGDVAVPPFRHESSGGDNFCGSVARENEHLRNQVAQLEQQLSVNAPKTAVLDKAITLPPLESEKTPLAPPGGSRRAMGLEGIVKVAVDNTVVLSFCSIEYLEPMTNWIAFMVRNGITNYGIVCLDLELREWLQVRGSDCNYILSGWKHGVWDPAEPKSKCSNQVEGDATTSGPMTRRKCKTSCELSLSCRAIAFDDMSGTCTKCKAGWVQEPHDKMELEVKRTTTTLWYARWKLLVRLLMSNIHVMLADLDAIFLTNPFTFVNNLPAVDMMGQRGSFPPWLGEKWGAALCMGYVFWKSTIPTKQFISVLQGVIEQCGDDQIAVNEALDRINVKWEEGKVSFTESKNTSYGSTDIGLRVALLPHAAFPRQCDAIPIEDFKRDVVVAHCYESIKGGEAKKKKAKAYGLWIIRDDWQQVPVSNDFTQYVQSLIVPW
ncbi:hypothetical protein DIPPA_14715 [Diplonema papillatum]|nr:hypothetical protein DIPPA_14715 [Diplonema papillatum]